MFSKLQDGNFIICGFVPSDSALRTTQSGKSLCKWSVKVGEVGSGEEREAKWVNCQAWQKAAQAASRIRKGDTVLAVGRIEENEYNGKTYKNLVCEFVSVMPYAAEPDREDKPDEPYTADVGNLSQFEEILGDGDVPF